MLTPHAHQRPQATRSNATKGTLHKKRHSKHTLVGLSQAQLGEQAASAEQAGGVARGVVGQPDLNAILGELVRVGGADDLVALNLGIRYLRDDVLVGEPDDKAVLGRVVLVLGLSDKLAPGVVVRLALCTGGWSGSGGGRRVSREGQTTRIQKNKQYYALCTRAEFYVKRPFMQQVDKRLALAHSPAGSAKLPIGSVRRHSQAPYPFRRTHSTAGQTAPHTFRPPSIAPRIFCLLAKAKPCGRCTFAPPHPSRLDFPLAWHIPVY